MKISLDTKKLQRVLKKELQKAVQKEQVATSVSMWPDMNGIKLLDKMSEDALTIILKEYDGNSSYSVGGDYDSFPEYMQFSLEDIFSKLKLSGIIASYFSTLSGWNLHLTPDALTYFDDKQRYLERREPMFKKLPSNTRKLLQEIIDAEDPAQMLRERFENSSVKENDELRSLVRELIQEGYIRIPSWDDDKPSYLEINNSARTYAEREAEYERQMKLSTSTTYHIDSITASGSNLVLGDVVNSFLNIDSSIKRITSEIEKKGGEDKAALNALLEESKEIIENIKTTRQIPKNGGFFKRLSSHIEKHGWFYGEIVGLIGTAALQLMQG